MIIREATRSDLDAIIALLHEDVIREIDESQVDPNVVRRGGGNRAADLGAAPDLRRWADVSQVRAQKFYTELGFAPSHVGMKYYLGGPR